MDTNTELEKYQKLLIETNEALQGDPDDEVLIETRDKIQETIKELQAGEDDSAKEPTVNVSKQEEQEEEVKQDPVQDSRSARSREKRRRVRDEEDRTYDKLDSEVPKRKPKKSRARTDEPKPSKLSTEPSRNAAAQIMEITANNRLGQKLRVKCSPEDTVGDLKKLIAAQSGSKASKIHLKGWYGEFKDHITLADYEIHDGINLELY